MTKIQRQIRTLAYKAYPDATTVRHIYPEAYCVARPAEHCAVLAVPPAEGSEAVGGYVSIHNASVEGLAVGEWAAIAYVCRPHASEFRVIL